MELALPENKDQSRIYDIVRKAMPGGMRRNAFADPDRANRTFMILDARRMNNKITDEGKRFRRYTAAIHYGLHEIANVFAGRRDIQYSPVHQEKHIRQTVQVCSDNKRKLKSFSI